MSTENNTIASLIDSLESSRKIAIRDAKEESFNHAQGLINIIFDSFTKAIRDNPTDSVITVSVSGNESEDYLKLFWKSTHDQLDYDSIPFTVYALKKAAKILNKINCRLSVIPTIGFNIGKDVKYEFYLVVSEELTWKAKIKSYILRTFESEFTQIVSKINTRIIDLCHLHAEVIKEHERKQLEEEQKKVDDAMLFINWLIEEFENQGKQYPFRKKHKIICIIDGNGWVFKEIPYSISQKPYWSSIDYSKEQVENAIEILRKNNKSLGIACVQEVNNITRYIFKIRLD